MFGKFGHNTNYLIIIILCFILYGNTIPNEYALDDTAVIYNNQFTKKGIFGCWEILTTDAFTGYFGKQENLVTGGRYRPLSMLTFAVEYQLFGENPHVSHFINVIYYTLLCLLIYNLLVIGFAKRFSEQNSLKSQFVIPLIISVLFIAHPLHTEVVANIKGRDEIFALLFSLGSLWFIIKYFSNKKFKYLIFCSISFFLALISKENAITFLAIIPLSLYFFGNKIEYRIHFKYLIIITLPLILAILCFGALRWAVIGFNSSSDEFNLMNNPFLNTSADQKYATIFYTLLIYIKLLFIPHPLTVDYYPYHISIVNWANYQAIAGLIVYLSLFVIAILTIRIKSIYSFSILLYLICLSVVSNLFVTTGTFMGERFIFFSSLGFCISIGYLLFHSVHKLFNNKVKIINTITTSVTVAIILVFSYLSIQRNFVWKNDFTLFTHDVKISSESAFSNKSAGNHLIEEALKYDENNPFRKEYLGLAVEYLTKAITINPTYEKALFLLGNAHFLYNKDYKASWQAYKNLLYMDPSNEDTHKNIPIIMADCDDIQFQKKVFTELYNIQPNRSYINYYLGRIYRLQNKLDSAVFYLENAIKIDKSDFNSLIELGVTYSQLKNYSRSLQLHEIAYELDQNNVTVLKNLVILHNQLGNKDKAQLYKDKLTNLSK